MLRMCGIMGVVSDSMLSSFARLELCVVFTHPPLVISNSLTLPLSSVYMALQPMSSMSNVRDKVPLEEEEDQEEEEDGVESVLIRTHSMDSTKDNLQTDAIAPALEGSELVQFDLLPA